MHAAAVLSGMVAACVRLPRWRRWLHTLVHRRAGRGQQGKAWAEHSREDRTTIRLSRRPQQGRLGDCWVLAPLLAIHDVAPELIAQMVVPVDNDSHTSGGARWRVTLGLRGPCPREVIVDRSMPVLADGRWLGARQAGEGPGWPGLVEKALVADRAGCYPFLRRGLGLCGLSTLTGVPTRMAVMRLPSPAQITRLLDEGYALVASTHPLSAGVHTAAGPLPRNHVFALVGADAQRGTVQLRNPWDPDRVLELRRREFRRGFVSVDRTLQPLR